MTVLQFPRPTEGKRKRPLHPSERNLLVELDGVDPFTTARHVSPSWKRSCLPWCPACWPRQYATQHALHRSDRP